MSREFGALVSWLKARQPRLDIRDEDLLERFWRMHPRFQFLKSLPWASNVLDIGAGNGGLAHWKGWLKPDRADLNLYGVDRNAGEFSELYAGWETVDLDRAVPEFPGVALNGFIASHLIEYLGAPETLIEWLGERAETGAWVYLEWLNPTSLDLPTREQLGKYGIEVLTSNFIDDWEHKQAPDLARLGKWLADAGFTVMSSGAVDLGILGEELFARGADSDTRSMGYWSMTRSSFYVIAIKSAQAADRAVAQPSAPTGAGPDPATPRLHAAAAERTASGSVDLLRAKRSLLTSGLFDQVFYRATYADMRVSTADPLTHYITKGEAEGRRPNAVFAPRYYRRQWMAGAAADQNALFHYIEEGERRGLKPHPAFDPKDYLAANPPLAEFVDRPLFHYLAIGRDADLPVAPGPRGQALARVLQAQRHAIEFDSSGRHDDAALNRYKGVLVTELGSEEGVALFRKTFDLPNNDAPDADATPAARPTGPAPPVERSFHRIDPIVSELLDGSMQDEQPRPASPEEQLKDWLRVSEAIPGTTRGELARELARTSLSLPPGALIVEIGAFMGSGTVLLAGPRKTVGSGKIYVVDPFDCSGDPRSTPIYERVLQAAGGGLLLDHFVENIRRAGLGGWIEVRQGRAPEIATDWRMPVDMIYIDLDISGEAAEEAYDSWHRFLKPGGVIVIHNSDPDGDQPGNSRDRVPIEHRLRAPDFIDVRIIDGNTFARKPAAEPVP